MLGAALVLAPVGGMAIAEATSRTSSVAAAHSSGSVVVRDNWLWKEAAIAAGQTNLDVVFNVRTNKIPTGHGESVALVARRTSAGNEYRIRVRFTANRSVRVTVTRLVNGNKVVLVPETTVSGVIYRVGDDLSLHFRVSGTPATLAVNVWRAGQTEPRTWSELVTDSSAALAAPGWWGMSFGVLLGATNPPVRYNYDGLDVVDVSASSPQPTDPPSATPAPSPTPTPSATSTPTPTASPSPTPSPTPSATPSPTPTPSPIATLGPNSYVVSPNGNDSASGSPSAPWRTLQNAADSAPSGASIFVRNGTYSGFSMYRSGTASAPITFKAYPGETPVLDGGGAVPWTVKLSGVSYVNLDGLTVQGGYADGQDGGGVLVVNSSNVAVTHSVLRDNKAFGIRTYNSTYVTIDHNDISHNATGVRIDRAGEGVLVTNNLIHENDKMMVNTPGGGGDDVGAIGVGITRTTGHSVISGNLIWGNRAPSYDFGWDGGAMDIYAASNWTFTNNVTWDNENVFESGTDSAKTPCDGNVFTHNLNYAATTQGRTYGMILRCGSNMLVANNTFVGMQNFVFALSDNEGTWGGSIAGLRLLNNVVSASNAEVFRLETALPASVAIDYNLVQVGGTAVVANGVPNHGSTTSLSTYRSWTGYEMHGIQADPLFVDAGSNEFGLLSNSPAVDTAIGIPGVTDSFAGSGPDIGYLERR